MRKLLLLAIVLSFSMGGAAVGEEKKKQDDEPKYTIKEIMKKAHGQKLLNKVVAGEASKEEKDQLLDLYISLLEHDPPKGEQQAWVMKSGRLTVAAAMVAVGRKGAEARLKEASNCKACHNDHKGK